MTDQYQYQDLLEGLDQAVSIDPPEIIMPLLDEAAAAIRALLDERESNRVMLSAMGPSADALIQAEQRVAELEQTLAQIRDNMSARRVFDFDYENGEYPITAEVVQMLVLEKHDLAAKVAGLEAKLHRSDWAHDQAAGFLDAHDWNWEKVMEKYPGQAEARESSDE